jgi:hypothetical protein
MVIAPTSRTRGQRRQITLKFGATTGSSSRINRGRSRFKDCHAVLKNGPSALEMVTRVS